MQVLYAFCFSALHSIPAASSLEHSVATDLWQAEFTEHCCSHVCFIHSLADSQHTPSVEKSAR